MMSYSVESSLLQAYSWMNFDTYNLFLTSKKSRTHGYNLMKGGGVWNLRFEPKGGEALFSATVASGFTVGQFYLAFIQVSQERFLSSDCTCQGAVMLSTGSSQICKHAVAILAALEAIRNCDGKVAPPKRFKREGMARFKRAPYSVIEVVEANLSWQDILTRLTLELPKSRLYGKGYHKVIKVKKQSNKKRKREENKKSVGERFLSKLSVKDLQEECVSRGIDYRKKKKADLVKTLIPFYSRNAEKNIEKEKEQEIEDITEGFIEDKNEEEINPFRYP